MQERVRLETITRKNDFLVRSYWQILFQALFGSQFRTATGNGEQYFLCGLNFGSLTRTINWG
jgi:hypothetical protein